MSGYTRQKAAEITSGAVARASDIAAELDQVQTAFNSSAGHTHSGASGEGAPVTVIGPAQDFIASSSLLRPKTDNTYDLGSATYEFKDGYFDGKLYTDAINLDGTDITSTAAELNILDGVTASAAELNILDGVTASTAELNILDGVTASAAELNILDGATLTVTELNYVDGVTSAIQTQLDAITGRQVIAGSGLTGGGALSGNVTVDVGAGDGISVAANAVAVDSTVLRNSGTQSTGALDTTGDITVGSFNLGFASSSGVLLDAVSSDNNGVIRVKTFSSTSNSSPVIISYQGLSERFVVAANGNVTNLNNSYGAISDERKKTNIEDINPQLDELRELRVRKFNLVESPEEPKQSGLVAQEVLKIKPGLVEEDQEGFYSVKYSVLVPLLLKAVQELADKVDTLESRVVELEGV